MSIYKFTFNIAGDSKAEPWTISKTVDAQTLEEAVVKSWDGYQASINRIIKTPHESMVAFEPQINPTLFSLTGSCDGIPLDETPMLNAFYKERIRKFQEMKVKWR